MVIHIGMELAAGISPSGSPPRLACAPVPAVLSARAHSARDSNWRNRAVATHAAFVARNLSPGGAADILAMALFVRAMNDRP